MNKIIDTIETPAGSPRRFQGGESTSPNPWMAPGIAFLCGLAIILVAFWPSWRLLVEAWGNSETYSHGYIVAPIALWLVWRQRERLQSIAPWPNLLALFVMVAAIALWTIGDLVEVNLVRFVSVVTMVPALVLLCFGWRATRVIFFPLLFLYFMVPFGADLIPGLMDGTADATIAALRLTGIPVYREGLHFTLPTGRWSIVEACSGLRYMIAALVLSALFAHLNFRRIWKGVVFVAIALLISIAANWARAYLIVMIGHLTNMRYGIGDDHVVYGWFFFGLVMMVIFWMGMRYSDADSRANPADVRKAGVASADKVAGTSSGRARGMSLAGGVAGVLIASGAALIGVDAARDIDVRSGAKAVLEAGLQPLEAGPIDIEPVYQGATAVVQGVLPGRGTAMQAYVAYFARQHVTGEMVRWGNQVLALDNKKWGTFKRRNLTVGGEGGGFQVQERLVRRGSDERLIWSWYTVAGRSSASERGVKLLTLRAMVSGAGDHSTVNVLIAPVGQDGALTAEALRRQAVRTDALARGLTAASAQ